MRLKFHHSHSVDTLVGSNKEYFFGLFLFYFYENYMEIPNGLHILFWIFVQKWTRKCCIITVIALYNDFRIPSTLETVFEQHNTKPAIVHWNVSFLQVWKFKFMNIWWKISHIFCLSDNNRPCALPIHILMWNTRINYLFFANKCMNIVRTTLYFTLNQISFINIKSERKK